MARYIAKVLIAIEADDSADAADSISACLTENLKYNDAILDWSYVREGGGYSYARRIPDGTPPDLEDECLTTVYEQSIVE